ncbi:uncharacterized protein VTP21DRAFT_11707 [Calcarisporiella thermophila]|uniref:uncharacterized protein n=1 Tax=Calcarisporiella thermophila TaxID=911321 RepID=UPI003743C1E2
MRILLFESMLSHKYEPESTNISLVDSLINEVSLSHNLFQFLFQVYLSPCFIYFRYPNRAHIQHLFNTSGLDPAFLFSAVAWAAQHVYESHPATSYDGELRSLSEYCYGEAKRLISEVFDEPTIWTCLAALNLHVYQPVRSRLEDRNLLLGHAITMSRQLGIDWDNRGERDPLWREIKRRIWWTLFYWDIAAAMYSGNSRMLYTPCNLFESRPISFPHEDQETKEILGYMVDTVEWFLIFMNIPELDWTVTENETLAMLIKIIDLLKPLLPRFPPSFSTYSEDDFSSLNHLSSPYLFFKTIQLGAWAQRWFDLLQPSSKSSFPSSRINSPLMRELCALAFYECSKTAQWISLALEEVHLRKDSCRFAALGSNIIACRIHAYVIIQHQETSIKPIAMCHLIKTERILKCEEINRKGIAKILRKKIKEIFEELENTLKVKIL